MVTAERRRAPSILLQPPYRPSALPGLVYFPSGLALRHHACQCSICPPRTNSLYRLRTFVVSFPTKHLASQLGLLPCVCKGWAHLPEPANSLLTPSCYSSSGPTPSATPIRDAMALSTKGSTRQTVMFVAALLMLGWFLVLYSRADILTVTPVS